VANDIQKNVSLLPYNTFRVDIIAESLLVVRNIADLNDLPKEQLFILGEGANILFTKNFDGLVLKNELLGKEIISDDKASVTIKVASGEIWINLVNFVVDNGWSGIENLAYIPGTVGAAPVQNLAAYGQNAGEVVDSITGINLETREMQTLSYEDCKLYYRDSIFKHKLKNKFFIASVQFKLFKSANFDTHYYGSRPYESLQTELDKISRPPYTPKIIATAVTNQRKIKLPDLGKLGTAGSFFENPFVNKSRFEDLKRDIPDLQAYPINKMLYPNPDDPVFKMEDKVKIPAGKLLDILGWRGKRIGKVGTYEKHALVVVNHGEATGEEILEFTYKMQADIKSHFEINLEAEVNII